MLQIINEKNEPVFDAQVVTISHDQDNYSVGRGYGYGVTDNFLNYSSSRRENIIELRDVFIHPAGFDLTPSGNKKLKSGFPTLIWISGNDINTFFDVYVEKWDVSYSVLRDEIYDISYLRCVAEAVSHIKATDKDIKRLLKKKLNIIPNTKNKPELVEVPYPRDIVILKGRK